MTHFTDTHCHLDFESYDADRQEVLNRAWEAGLVWILNPGIDPSTNQAAIKLASAYPKRINAAIGIHPNFGKPWTHEIYQKLKEQAQIKSVVAIGEIGLDYYRQHTPQKQQISMFTAQLDLAAELKLPVIVHNRQSTQDLMQILREWHARLVQANSPLADRPGVLHSFSADLETAKAAIDLNFFIGISGPVTFKNAPEIKSIVQNLPLDHLLLETDAPFLAPHPHRGKRNEPAFIPLIAGQIALLHEISVKDVADITHKNAMNLFKQKD